MNVSVLARNLEKGTWLNSRGGVLISRSQVVSSFLTMPAAHIEDMMTCHRAISPARLLADPQMGTLSRKARINYMSSEEECVLTKWPEPIFQSKN
jgi:hypothetical protein